MLSVGTALIIGAIISALGIGAGAIYSNSQNKKNQAKAYQQQKDLMAYEQKLNQESQDRTYRLYNSPTAQRHAQEAAGLNPFAQASTIQSMNTSSPEVSGGTPPGFAPTQNPFSGFQNLADSFSSGASMHQQQKLIDAQVAESNARTNKTLLESELLQNAVDMKEYTNEVIRQGALGKKLQNRLYEFQGDLLAIEKQYAPEERSAKIQELWSRQQAQLQAAAKTAEEKEIIARMAKYVDEKEQSVIDLNKANAEAAKGQAKASEAQAANLDADTETQNQVREHIVKEKSAKAALAKAEEALIESNSEAVKMQNELNNWLATQKMQRKPTESYWEMALQVADRYLEYRGQNIQRDKGNNENNLKLLGMILRYAIAKGI